LRACFPLQSVTSASIQIAANPKLCVTIPELNGILEGGTVHNLEAKVCDEIHPSESVDHVCRVGDSASLASIPASCETLVGRITVDHSSSSEDVWKLYNVTRIFGKLTIRNSSLVGFSPLWKLRQIVNLAGYESALVVESNVRLKSVFVKNLYRMLSDLPTRIENNPRLEMSLDDCDSYQSSAQIDFRNNKMDCLALRRKSSSADGTYGSITFFFTVIVSQFL
ncbi:receptor L domain protein, partial [Ancylostoma caninum]